jgi:hypothetical protein
MESPKVGPTGSFDYLTDNIVEYLIARCEGDGSFDLNLKDCWVTEPIMGMNDHIIQRMTLGRPLELDAVYGCAGQAAWLGTRQHRK